MSPQNTDFIAVMTFAASLVFSQEVAGIVGPYVSIIAASSVGASFALAKRAKGTRAEARMFFARTVAIALMFSVIFSQIAHSYHPALDERLSLIPIAMLLGFGGDDMPRLLAAIWKKLISLVNSRKDQ